MNVIEVENLSRKFKINKGLENPSGILSSLRIKKPNQQDIWAIKDLNFLVNKGEWFGIIGENGSGKTTLLKTIAGILEPTEGKIKTKGKIASIIGLGTGFKQELTAKENVYLYSSLMGLSESEIKQKYQDIVSFSELYDYMNTKFKKFSDGMKARLAFSTAINVDADIILSDEVLSVGDSEFKTKCLQKMEELKQKNKTIVFVSHTLSSIKEWCDRAIFIDNGEIRSKGEVDEVISDYRKFITWKGKNEQLRKFKTKIGQENNLIKDFILENRRGKEAYIYKQGEELNGQIKLSKNFDRIKISLIESRMNKEKLLIYSENLREEKRGYVLNFHLDSLWLDKGPYKIVVEADNELILEDIQIEIVEGKKKLPEVAVVPAPGNDSEFPQGKFYIFGDVSDFEGSYLSGIGVPVYKHIKINDLKDNYKQGEIVRLE